MKSVGEVVAIGRNIHESMQKALRGLETGLSGFDAVENLIGASRDDILAELARPTPDRLLVRSEEHTSELQSLMRISYAVFCLKKKTNQDIYTYTHTTTKNTNTIKQQK